MKLKFIIILVLSVVSVSSISAKEKTTAVKKTYSVRQGDKSFEMFDFSTAVSYYSAALSEGNKDTVYVFQKIADAYRQLNDSKNAEIWYARVLAAGDKNVKNLFWYAEALRANQKYDEARKFFKQYQGFASNDKRIGEILEGIDKLEDLTRDKGIYKIVNLDINSPASDFGPAFYRKGQLFFTSNRASKIDNNLSDSWSTINFYQIYRAASLSDSELVSKVESDNNRKPNGRFHDGPVYYIAKDSQLVFTRSNYVKTKATAAKDKRTVNLKLYSMSYPYHKGNSLYDFPFNNNEYSNAHPSFTQSGDTMYFTSDRPGGLGGCDIYFAVKRNGVWGKPIGLGSVINSKYEEKFPFIAADGTLYFSSNALGGLGGLDIYQSKYVNGSWTKPVNLGTPVNSNADDFTFIIDEADQTGYFSSNREGGHGDDDIYAFTKTTTREFRIRVIDADTKQSVALSTVSTNLNAEDLTKLLTDENGERKLLVDPNVQQVINISKPGYKTSMFTIQPNDKSGELVIELKKLPLQLIVTVKDKETLEPVANVNVLINGRKSGDLFFKTGPSGFFESTLGQGNYIISSPDYNTISGDFSDLDADPVTGVLKKEYLVTRVKFTVGQKWVLKNFYYDLDKSFIRPDAVIELDNIVKVMSENPTLEIELSSHTDCRNSKAYNQALSERRAKAAVEYIVNKGISASRIKAVGYGETQLTNACACEGAVQSTCTEEEHQANRRTEVKVLKY